MGDKLIPSTNVSVSTFQSFDGSNYTLAGIEGKLKYKNVTFGGFGGVGTDFNGSTSIVTDAKLTHSYNKTLNQNLRIRNKISEDTNCTQIRYSPLSINIPIGENTNIYANPHYVAQINSNTNEWKHSAGIFVGATQKFKNLSISAEIQRYNLQNIKDNSGANWSGNVIISYNF